ncbi:MAG TPA: hypothetical protein VEL76_28700 [Gemmataceae bacterium]|nr:hypothetical protein [Gemmataceae bacterium]
MSGGKITRHGGTTASITRHLEITPVNPPPSHTGWRNYVSQRSVRAIVVSPASETLWLATWGGVLEWRRKEDRFYRRHASEHGLASNAVACLALGEDGRVWAGHDEGGISCFEKDCWRVHEDLAGEPIRALCASHKAGLWAATPGAVYHAPSPGVAFAPVARDDNGSVEARALLADGDTVLLANAWGLFRIRPGHSPEPIEPQTLTSCVALVRDRQDDVWIATPRTVYRLRNGCLEGPFVPPAEEAPERICGLAAGKGAVWVWASSGLGCVVEGHWQSLPWPRGLVPPTAVRAIASWPGDPFLWAGTDERLAVVWLDGQEAICDPEVLAPESDDKLNNLGRCIAGPSPGGDLWVGTAGGLITFHSDGSWDLDSDAGDIRDLCLGEGGLHVLAWPRGLGRLAGTGPVTFAIPQPSGILLALALGQADQPYVLTTRGLWRLAPGGLESVADGPLEEARCVAQTADGVWWLGTVRGVWRRTAAGHWAPSGEQSGPGQAEITALLAAGGTLWVATTAGLWSREGFNWQPHRLGEASAPDAVVRAVAPTQAGSALWVASETRLLRYGLAAGTVMASYTACDSGLGSMRIMALCEAPGALLVVTQAGVSRLALT